MRVQVCLFALCSLIFHCSSAYAQAAKKNDSSAEWEYKQLYNPSDEILNHYAKDGWEVGAAAASGDDTSHIRMVILKRIDTPTAGSGGILASPRTACRGRSYTRSTSALRLGMPYRDEYSYSFVSDVFGRIMISVMAKATSGTGPKTI